MEDTKDPIHQGALDGLCGLYAIINACNNIDIDLEKNEREELFNLADSTCKCNTLKVE